MRRVEFLRKKWMSSEALKAAAQIDHSLPSDAKIFDFLLDIDPTSKKIYADFVLRCYANGEFLAEDSDRLKETLSAFDANKRRLPIAKRDIGAYSSERDVWEVLSAAGLVVQPESGKQAKRSDRNRAHLESEVLHADGWTMAHLKTAFAARWWGIGTRWCTTEKSGRTYNHYAQMGSLRVFVSPQGIKHQLHIGTGSLCDATDKPVGMESYLERLPPSFLDVVRSDIAAAFAATDIDDKTSLLYRRTGLLSLPRSLFGPETLAALERMKEGGLAKLKNAVSADGWSLKVSACDLSGWAIRFALGGTYDFTRDRRQVLGMVETPQGGRHAVDFSAGPSSEIADLVMRMPNEFMEAVLSKFVKSWQGKIDEGGREIDAVLRRIDPSQLSEKFWKSWAKKAAAFPSGGDMAFGFVPDEVMSLEMAHVFAKSGAKHRIPKNLLTDGVAKALAKHDLSFLEDPEVIGVLNMRQLANVYGCNNGGQLKHLPQEHRTAEMVRLIVDECPGTLRRAIALVEGGSIDLQAENKADFVREITMNALEKRSACVSDVTIPLPREVYLKSVGVCSSLLAWVPLEYRDVEMCAASISGEHAEGLYHFPAWVVEEIRAASDGEHGITQNYRPSQKYGHILKALRKPEGEIPKELPPFKSSDFAAPEHRR
jgi:hypothetical protein